MTPTLKMRRTRTWSNIEEFLDKSRNSFKYIGFITREQHMEHLRQLAQEFKGCVMQIQYGQSLGFPPRSQFRIQVYKLPLASRSSNLKTLMKLHPQVYRNIFRSFNIPRNVSEDDMQCPSEPLRQS